MQNVVAEGLEGTERVWEPSVDERSTGCSPEESRTGRSSTAEAEDPSLSAAGFLLIAASIHSSATPPLSFQASSP